MWKKGDKRGLSEVVTTLIIILLSLVAIGIVWVVISNILSEGTEDINLNQFSVDVDFVSASINGNDVTMTVKRTSGQGDMTGLKFILSDGSNSEEFTESESLTALQTKTFTVTLSSLNPANLEDAAVAPVYSSGSKEQVGGITDTYTFSGGNGNGNGGGTGDPNTGICGDGIIQSPNADSPAIMEQCDGTNLGNPPESCVNQGFASGQLGCTIGCQFDTSPCNQGTPETPASCDGTWNQTDVDDGNECDGTPLPNGCAASCMCGDGFTQNGFGGCALNPPINEGTIFSVWPAGAAKYFDSEDLPTDMTEYTKYYVNFTNSPENGCFRISYAEYLDTNGRSYIRTELIANIDVNQIYSIWEAQNCGQ